LIKKRPLSTDVLEIDGKQPHYKFPLGAISSIANRATGVALSVGQFSFNGLLVSIMESLLIS
jgi:succinate dehydrogenase (ubiquinone) cytochrome b560 subunit